ncbi:MAG: ATP-binding protein [Acidimicrobiales bacterium]|jgi:signal transduction histidine kinase
MSAGAGASAGGTLGDLGGGTLTLRRRLGIMFAVGAVLLAAAMAVSAVSLVRLFDARHTILSEVDPASLLSQELLVAYVDEETGVRGYVLTDNATFLQPYNEGHQSEKGIERLLGKLLDSDPIPRALLAAAEARGAAWRTQYAVPAIAATRDHDPSYASNAELLHSKDLFDAFRTALASLNSTLAQSRIAATNRLNTVSDTLTIVLIIGAALLLFSGIVGWRLLRVWVTGPLGSLSEDARKVAAGDLTHEVAIVGPPELAMLAADTEAMRRRIVGELDAVTAARSELASLNAELARSNVELEQFAYVASHDLQEPLRKVVSFCQLLQQRYQGQLDDRADEYIGFAVDGAQRMQTLINDLLAFSRIGRTTAGFADVDLGACATAAIERLSAAREESGAHIHVGPLPVVRGDAGLLTTVFQNLVGNSLKFHGDDPAEIWIDAVRQGDEWLCSVTDTGIGIEARFAERVFVIFQRLHSRDAYEGSGIGLALCKKILEFHGGRIFLDTEHAPGTRICFTLPSRPGGPPDEPS